jgi:hypothetical protein
MQTFYFVSKEPDNSIVVNSFVPALSIRSLATGSFEVQEPDLRPLEELREHDYAHGLLCRETGAKVGVDSKYLFATKDQAMREVLECGHLSKFLVVRHAQFWTDVYKPEAEDQLIHLLVEFPHDLKVDVFTYVSSTTARLLYDCNKFSPEDKSFESVEFVEGIPHIMEIPCLGNIGDKIVQKWLDGIRSQKNSENV